MVDARLARKAMVNDILLVLLLTLSTLIYSFQTDIQFKDAREWPYSAPDEEGVNVLTDPETQEILSISVTKMIELMTKPIHHGALFFHSSSLFLLISILISLMIRGEDHFAFHRNVS